MKRIFIIVLILMTGAAANAQLLVGTEAPEISLPDMKDSVISLSSLKGKVVLVDFWASWCGPCRASNPAVVRLYKKYKAKGFEVFAISIDSKKPNWLKAIRQDRLTYLQVNDNSGWNSAVAEKYFVNEIPTSFLLDKTGKIMAIDADGSALEKKVKELLEQ